MRRYRHALTNVLSSSVKTNVYLLFFYIYPTLCYSSGTDNHRHVVLHQSQLTNRPKWPM